MHVRFCVAVGLGAALVAAPVPAQDADTTRALAALKAVGKEGKGNENAGPAWKTVTSKGVAGLLPALEAIDDANPTAGNWLRSAATAIADAEKTAGRKLPGDVLEAFATNPKFAPSARRIAYELLLAQDPAGKDRLLPRFLNDKSPDLRRDAITSELDRLETADKATAKAGLERLFALTRDLDQVEKVAKLLGEHGAKPSVTEHFGFVTGVSLVGPFDGPDGKGFETRHPPEEAPAATGTFKGKDGAEVMWVPATTTDKYGSFDLNKLVGKHKNAVAYALAVIGADKDMPCEVRVTSITSVKIFLNGKEIFGRDEYHHGDPFDAHVGKGALKKGENVLVLKVCQNDEKEPWAQDWKFKMRVCDDTGGPLPLQQHVVENGAAKTVKLGFNPNPTEEKEEKK